MVLDGGAGINTLKIDGTGQTLDLTNATIAAKVSNFSVIDLTGTGNNILKINAAAAQFLSGASDNALTAANEAKMLVVNGDLGDSVQLLDPQLGGVSQWKSGAVETGASLTTKFGSSQGFVTGQSYKPYMLAGTTVYVNTALAVTDFGASTSPASTQVTSSATVQDVFGTHFTDADGSGVAKGQFKGVVITDAGTAAEQASMGKYQYSTNGGTTWLDLAAGLSDADSVFLAPTALIRFQAAAGAVAVNQHELLARLVDQSGLTGTAGLSNGQLNVDASLNGGSTAFSGTPITLKDLSAPNAPTIVNLQDNVGQSQGFFASGVNTDDATPTLTGSAEAGAVVKLYNNGVEIGSTTANAAGVWTYTPASNQANGVYNITAKAVDVNNNLSAASSTFTYTLESNVAPLANPTQLSNVFTTVAPPPAVVVSDNQPAASVNNSTVVTFNLKFNQAIKASTLTESDLSLTSGTLQAGSLTAVPASKTTVDGVDYYTEWTVKATAPSTTSGTMVLSLANGSYTNSSGMAGSAGFGMQAFGVQTAPAPSVGGTYDEFSITFSNSQIKALSNGKLVVVSSMTNNPGEPHMNDYPYMMVNGNYISTETAGIGTVTATVWDTDANIAEVGSNGSYVVAWRSQALGVMVQQFNADNTPLNPVYTSGYLLNGVNLTSTAAAPKVGGLGTSGKYVVTWSDGSAIKYQVFNANMTTTGYSTVTLNGDAAATTAADSDPNISAINADGSAVITWTGVDSNGDSSIFVQKLTSTGLTTGYPIIKLEATGVTDKADTMAKVTAVGNSGAYVVSWSGVDEGGDASIYVQKFNVDGSLSGAASKLESLTSTTGIDKDVQVVSTGTDGSYVVAWVGDGIGGNRVFVQRFNADGSAKGAITSLDRGYGQTQVQLIGYGDGSYAVGWLEGEQKTRTNPSGPSGNNITTIANQVYVRKYAADGVALWTESYQDPRTVGNNPSNPSSINYPWGATGLQTTKLVMAPSADGGVVFESTLQISGWYDTFDASWAPVYTSYQVIQQGTIGPDGAFFTTTGGTTATTINGTDYADVITAGGGADIIFAGGNNDTVILNTDNVDQLSAVNSMMIDGGTGVNFLQISNTTAGTGVTLDLTNSTVIGKLHNFNSIDITGPTSTATNNTIKLNLAAVLALAGGTDNAATLATDESKMLVITGNLGDTAQFVNLASWTVGATDTAANLANVYGTAYKFQLGHSYTAYTLSGATVFVDQAMTVASATASVGSTLVYSQAMSIESLFGPKDGATDAFYSFTDSNTAGSPNAAFKGVAIVAAGTATEVAASGTGALGHYQLSKDGGTTWIDVAGGLSDTNAVYADKTALIRYAGAVGVDSIKPQNLTVRLIDNSGQTGTLAYSAASTGTTIDAHINGGGTAFSGGNPGGVGDTVTTNLVNRSPFSTDADGVIIGDMLGTAVGGFTTAKTVEALFGATYSDADSNLMRGVAITLAGTASDLSKLGKYQYSSNSGSTWVDLAADLTDSTSVFLTKTDLIRFVPTAANATQVNKFGITVRFVDDSAAVAPASGATVDVSGSLHGGNTAYSANTLTLYASTAPLLINDVNSATEASGTGNSTPGINPIGNVLSNDQDVTHSTSTLFVQSILKGTTGIPSDVTIGTTSVNGQSISGLYGTLKIGADGSYAYTVDQNNATVQALNSSSTAVNDVFTYTVKDASGATNTATLTVGVNGANDAPIVATLLADTTATQNTAFSYTVPAAAFSDVDSTLTYTATGMPAGVTFNAATRTFSGTPTVSGNYNVTVTASDGALSVSDVFAINIGVDALVSKACAATIYEGGHLTNGTGFWAWFSDASFAGATIKFYVNSTLSDTATLDQNGSYYQLGSNVVMTVSQGAIVHAELVKNGVTYIVGGGQQILASGSGTPFTYATPLVLDLNGDGVQTVGLNESVQFDLTDSGTPQKSSWVDKQDGLLAMDLNGDGQINSGAELFGSSSKLADGSVASTGWAALAALDTNGDGKIDASDAGFDKLRVWVDADADAATDAGELKTLAQVGVTSIDLSHNNVVMYQNGNALQGFSKFTTADGKTHDIVDVSFLVQPVLADASVAADAATRSNAIAGMTAASDAMLAEATAVDLLPAEIVTEFFNKPYMLTEEELAALNPLGQTTQAEDANVIEVTLNEVQLIDEAFFVGARPLVEPALVETTNVDITPEDVAAAIAVCTGVDSALVYALNAGPSLDLTTVLKDVDFNGIVKDLGSDPSGNNVSLTLADVLGLPTTNGVHQLMLTGAANDKLMLTEAEWTDTGTVVNQNGHTYAVYNGTTDPSAQLLIDQQMLQSHQTS